MSIQNGELKSLVNSVDQAMDNILRNTEAVLKTREVGTVTMVGNSVARISGLNNVGFEEGVIISNKYLGMVQSINEHGVNVALLDKSDLVEVGSQAVATGGPISTKVGEALLGRVVDALGRPLDGKEVPIGCKEYPIERPAVAILDRQEVSTPMETGIKAIDGMIPIGKGQRELILGDRQTGKSTIAIDAICHQKGRGVICIYCSIGQRESSLASVLTTFRQHGAMDYTIIVMGKGNDSPALQYITPYAATSMAEYFREQGKDVLIVYDDLTKHARAYRELSLLIERSPGREAYPGDIFYAHSRLLERSSRVRDDLGGGSITSLPIIETEAQNVSAYIPTNVISITDGQIYLSPERFQKGILPAIDIGTSVSRVGSKAQLPAYKAIAGVMGLEYSQFEELETFSKFATKLDNETKHTLNRGHKLREVLKQKAGETFSAAEQVAIFLAVTEGAFDEVEQERIGKAQKLVCNLLKSKYLDMVSTINNGQKMDANTKQQFLDDVRVNLGLAGNSEDLLN